MAHYASANISSHRLAKFNAGIQLNSRPSGCSDIAL
jgi:hypothetical protein